MGRTVNPMGRESIFAPVVAGHGSHSHRLAGCRLCQGEGIPGMPQPDPLDERIRLGLNEMFDTLLPQIGEEFDNMQHQLYDVFDQRVKTTDVVEFEGMRVGNCEITKESGFGNSIIDSYNGYLSAYWNLNETSGVREDSIGDNDLSPAPAGADSGVGIKGNAFQGTGTNDFKYLRSPETPDLSPTTGVAMSFWVRIDGVGAGWVFEKSGSFASYIDANRNVYWNLDAAGGLETPQTTILLATGPWHNILCIASATTAYIYVNGVRKDALAYTGPIKFNGSHFQIGGAVDHSYKGRIDEFAFWKDITFSSESDIDDFARELYSEGRGVFFGTTTIRTDGWIETDLIKSYTGNGVAVATLNVTSQASIAHLISDLATITTLAVDELDAGDITALSLVVTGIASINTIFADSIFASVVTIATLSVTSFASLATVKVDGGGTFGGIVTAEDLYLASFAGGNESIDHILDDTLHADVLDAIVVSDGGGVSISWGAGELWDHTAKDVVHIDASVGTIACTDNAINYLWWDRSAGTTQLTVSTTLPNISDDDVFVASINVADGDIYEINTVPVYSEQIPKLVGAFRDIFPSIITEGLLVSEHAGGGPFDVDMTEGVYYSDVYGKEVVTSKDSTVDLMTLWHQDGAASHSATTGVTSIDTMQWNTGNALAAVSAAKYYRSLFFVTSGGINWVYPTAEYNTIAQAIAGPDPILPFGLTDHPKSTVVILRGDDAAFPTAGGSRWIDVRPLPGSTGGSGIISDHANLANLAFASAGHTGFQAQGDFLDDINDLAEEAEDLMLFWDNSLSAMKWLRANGDLSITVNNLNVVSTLDTVTGRGSSTLSAITVGGLDVMGLASISTLDVTNEASFFGHVDMLDGLFVSGIVTLATISATEIVVTDLTVTDVASISTLDAGYITVALVSATTLNVEELNADELNLITQGPARFWDLAGDNYVGLTAPNTIATDFTLQLPERDGDADEFIKTDGAGKLSFGAAGAGAGDSIKKTFTQVGHGFVASRVVYRDPDDNEWNLASAGAALDYSKSLGVVESVDGDDFTVVFAGYISIAEWGLTDGEVYYMSAAAGEITTTEPTDVGNVSKPVLHAISATEAIVTSYRGITIAGGGGGLDSGLIVMWHGIIGDIPDGYVICDGNNGTPNLLTRFVQGVATAATNPGATGGSATHTLTIAQLASHSHTIPARSASFFGTAQALKGPAPTSTISTNATGSGSAHNNEPLFYDVAFLMKT